MTNSTVMRTCIRIALPVIIGGATLTAVGVAIATGQPATEPNGPGYNYGPTVSATPAPEAPWNKHGVGRVEELVPGYTR